MLEVLALSFGLAMDATAIAAIHGLNGHRRDAIVLPLLFGAFQAGMAALGWGLGAWGGPYVDAWDHWIAFGLLVAIGGKLLLDARRATRTVAAPRQAREGGAAVGPVIAVGLAIASSIDAAAAGLTLPMLPIDPTIALASIGVTTWACAVAGHAIGRAIGRRFEAGFAALGGVLLIAIGVRVLVLHG